MKIKIAYEADGEGGLILNTFLVKLTNAPAVLDHPKTIDLFPVGYEWRIVLVPTSLTTYQRFSYLAGGFRVTGEGDPGWTTDLGMAVFDAARMAANNRLNGRIHPRMDDREAAVGDISPDEKRAATAILERIPSIRGERKDGGGR